MGVRFLLRESRGLNLLKTKQVSTLKLIKISGNPKYQQNYSNCYHLPVFPQNF